MSKYITELANDIAKSCPDLVENGCGNDNCVACLAFKLIGLGYHKQEWISFDERLPDANTQVLAINSDGKLYLATYLMHKISPSARDHLTWASGMYNGKPTHWMPLPEPPKMKGGAE